MKTFLKDISTSLENQYVGFRILFWIDLVLAFLVAVGDVFLGISLAILALCIAIVANQKLILINLKALMDK